MRVFNPPLAVLLAYILLTTLVRCFNERIDREMSNIIDTVEDRIQNAILAAIGNIIAPKIELAIRSIKASSGRANSERGEHVGINALFENAYGNNNILQASNVNDETRNNIPDEVSELLVPETLFDQPAHTYHRCSVCWKSTRVFTLWEHFFLVPIQRLESLLLYWL